MPIDPADPGASVDALGHDHPDAAEYAAVAADLRANVSGDVRFDEYAQVLYATDGSIYQARPAGVVFPTDVADVQAAVHVPAHVEDDAAGTWTTCSGSTPEAQETTIQPGVVQDHLDARLAEHGLKFAPDPASSNRATAAAASATTPPARTRSGTASPTPTRRR